MKKIGIYTSGNAGTLTKILQTHLSSNISPYIQWIIHDGNVDTPAEYLAKNAQIPFFIFTQKDGSISDFLLEKALTHNVEYIFCFGDKILKDELLKHYSNKIINFHPSLLPAFKGLKAIDQALQYPALVSGNTAHFIDNGIDSGPIIMQNILSLTEFTNYDDFLFGQVAMFYQIYEWLNEERIKVIGKKVIVEKANYSLSNFIPNLEMTL